MRRSGLSDGEIRTRLSAGETGEHFLVQGRHAVAAALAASEFEVEAVAATGEPPPGLEAHGIPVLSLTRAEAESLLGFAFHRGVLAIARKPVRDFSAWAATARPRRLVVLENLADPGNVGTVIRNAAAFGFDAVICSGSGASPYNAKAVRASATGIFSLPVFVASPWRDLLRAALPGVTLVGTALAEDAISLAALVESPPPAPVAVVFGSEADGLSPATLAACEVKLMIPISRRVESLNVASASAILLHALGDPAADGGGGAGQG